MDDAGASSTAWAQELRNTVGAGKGMFGPWCSSWLSFPSYGQVPPLVQLNSD